MECPDVLVAHMDVAKSLSKMFRHAKWELEIFNGVKSLIAIYENILQRV